MRTPKGLILLALSFLCLPVKAQEFLGGHPMETSLGTAGNLMFTTNVRSGPLDPSIPPKPTRWVAASTTHPWVAVSDGYKEMSCVPGTTLLLLGGVMSKSCRRVSLEVDRHVYAIDHDFQAYDEYAFTWTASDVGTHEVQVVFDSKGSGAPVVAHTLTVTVSPEAPVSLASLSTSCNVDAEVALQRATVAGFKPSVSGIAVVDLKYPLDQIEYVFPADRKSLTIPTATMSNGNYEFFIVSCAADGKTFLSRPQVITVNHDEGTPKP